MTWIPVTERLPIDPRRPVLAWLCGTRIGDRSGDPMWVRAVYVGQFALDTDDIPFDGPGEYDEAHDRYCHPEGWYTWNADPFADFEWGQIDEDATVTHWQDGPAPPEVPDAHD